jgi:PAS domain S-box-containing protein
VLISSFDADHQYRFASKHYLDWFGKDPKDIIGKHSKDVLGEKLFGEIEHHRAAVLKGQTVRFEGSFPADKLGTRHYEATYSPEFEDSGNVIGYSSLVQDITERKRAEEALRAQTKNVGLMQQVAAAANEAASVEDALQTCLDLVCAYTGWPVGHAYMLAGDGNEKLAPTRIWHFGDPGRFEAFRRVTENTAFSSGVGLPGRVLASGEPAWIVDVTRDDNFPRAKLAADIGVKAAFAFPLLVNKDVVAIVEFLPRNLPGPKRRSWR